MNLFELYPKEKVNLFCLIKLLFIVNKLVAFVAVINVWPLNGLKSEPIQASEAVVSSSKSHRKLDTFWLLKEQPLRPSRNHSSPHSTDD